MFPPLDLAVDWSPPVKSRQISPRSVVVGLDGFTFIINLVREGEPQTIDAYKQDTVKNSDILPHEHETIETLTDGWSATYETVDKYWVYAQRRIRGKAYGCGGMTDNPTQQATLVRFCKAPR